MQEGAHQEDTAPMNLERSLHYRREGGIDQKKGGGRKCLCTRVLKVISDGKDGGRERVPVSQSYGDKRIGE